jgi:hypothetical protein
MGWYHLLDLHLLVLAFLDRSLHADILTTIFVQIHMSLCWKFNEILFNSVRWKLSRQYMLKWKLLKLFLLWFVLLLMFLMLFNSFFQGFFMLYLKLLTYLFGISLLDYIINALCSKSYWAFLILYTFSRFIV